MRIYCDGLCVTFRACHNTESIVEISLPVFAGLGFSSLSGGLKKREFVYN